MSTPRLPSAAPVSHRRLIRVSFRVLVLLALAGAALSACGGGSGGGGEQSFATCGNARLDDGERCDDGNRSDRDACTTACRPARCGDGVVYADVEECDGRDLNGASCAAVGRSGTLVCTADCRLDYSTCGDLLPTRAATPTQTATPPPSPTPTATMASACGDALLAPDESCESCPADCVAAACVASGTSATVPVTLSLPDGATVSSLTVSLAYRTNTIDLPAANLQSRIRATTGLVARAAPASTTEYALGVTVAASGMVPAGQAFTVTFDRCSGAAVPAATDFACRVTACGPAQNPVSGCRCAVAAVGGG